MPQVQELYSGEDDRRASSLDGVWRMDWGMAKPDEDGFGGIPFTLLVQRRRACGIDRRGVLLTAVFGQQTELSVEVVAWVDPAIVDVERQLRRTDGLLVREAQSYRGRLSVTPAGSTIRLSGTISHGDAAFNVQLELLGSLPG